MAKYLVEEVAGIPTSCWRTFNAGGTMEDPTTPIRFRSRRQFNRFLSTMGCRQRGKSIFHITKVIRQYDDGDILIHSFFHVDGCWTGSAYFLGARGGRKAEHHGLVAQWPLEEAQEFNDGQRLELIF